MCEPPLKRSRTASVGKCDKTEEGVANMKDSVDMFDSSGEEQDLSLGSNEISLGFSGVPFSSLSRLNPHGSATPPPPPEPGPSHTVAVKLPLQVIADEEPASSKSFQINDITTSDFNHSCC